MEFNLNKKKIIRGEHQEISFTGIYYNISAHSDKGFGQIC